MVTLSWIRIRTRWFEYTSELYKDDSRGQLPHIKPDRAGIPITAEEIQHALKRIPMKKAPGPYMEEAYSRAGLMTALKVARSVSFSLPHPVAMSAFIICSGLCACTKML